MRVVLVCFAVLLVAEASPHDRLLGGSSATKGDWPFVVAIEHNAGAGWNHVGAGAILNNRYVITAASVVEGMAVPSVRVVIGAANRAVSDEEDLVVAGNITIHGSYNSGHVVNRNDLAIIRTSRAMVHNAFVGSIELPVLDDTHEGETCYFTGWGIRSYGQSSFTTTLQQTTVTVISNTNCSSMVSDLSATVQSSHMCSYEMANNTAACRGDEGGPLVCLHDSVWHLGGVNTWHHWDGTGCARSRPSIYMRAERYLDWIATVTGIIPSSSPHIHI